MSISWGTPEGTNNEKVGIEITQSPATVVAATSSVTLTIKYYVYSQYSVNDNQVLTLTGASTGTSTTGLDPLDTVGSNVLVSTKTLVVNTLYSGTVSKTFSAAISGHYGGATPSMSRTWTVAIRPYAAPASPSTQAASRISTTKNRITWTNNPTTGAPYDYVYIDYTTDDTNYTSLAGPAGTEVSYDHTVPAGTSYKYRLRAHGPGGYSSYVYTGWTLKTPSVPTGISVAQNITTAGDGSTTLASVDISVTVPTFGETETPSNWYLEQWDSASNTWTQKYTSTIPSAPYTKNLTGLGVDSSFMFRARVGNVAGYSSYVTSGSVKSKPNMPVGPTLSTSLQVVKTAINEITLSWINPSNVETGTEVYWAYSSDFGVTWSTPWVKISTTAANATSYVHTSLDTTKWHKYYVRNVG